MGLDFTNTHRPGLVGGEFSLVDYNGNPVTKGSYVGQYRLMFFGFTHCKVVCPRNLSRLSKVLDLLGSHAEKIVPLYITVDPERDTPSAMKAFLTENYPKFIGLTGSRAQVDQAKSVFRVFSERRTDPEDPGGYVVPHTAITYLMDREGDYATHFPEHISDKELIHRILERVE